MPRQSLDHGAIPWLFASALATTLPHFTHQPVWLSFFAALLILWALRLWSNTQSLPNRWLLVVAVISACAGIFIEYRTLFGRDAGVAMLVIFMAMKLLEIKTHRDGMVVITLGYFLLLTHYLYSQTIPTAIWLLLALWLVTTSLVRLHGGAESSPKSSLRLAGLLTLQALPFMLVLYLLFPRISGPLWGLPQDAHAGRTGLSEQMSPGSISNLVQNGDIAFRVRFDAPPPSREKLYWRGPVLEHFDGRQWRIQPGRQAAEKIDALSQPIAYESTLEAHNQRWLLALDAPTQLDSEFALNGRLTATRREVLNERQRIRLMATLDYRFNINESPATLQRNLALPANFNPKTLALAQRWRDESGSPEAMIRQSLTFFSSNDFSYTLQPPLLGHDSIDEFIFTTRRGFCEHYSAAFVVLMRAAGIPARIVTGYQGGERNPVDNYLAIRQSDAHAWAEVWLAGQGWRRIDPTSFVAPSRIESGITSALSANEPLPALIQMRSEWLLNLRHRWEAMNNAWNQHILGYDAKRQREMLDWLGLHDADWKTLSGLLAASSALMLAMVSAWTFFQRIKPDPASLLWKKALHLLARRQVNCAPWESPLALAQRLKMENSPLADPVYEVAKAYMKVRYGKNPSALTELRAAISQLP